MSHTTGDKTKGVTVSTVSTPSKTAEQKEKRPHSEVAESSFGDELASIQKQLDQMCTDIHQTRDDLIFLGLIFLGQGASQWDRNV